MARAIAQTIGLLEVAGQSAQDRAHLAAQRERIATYAATFLAVLAVASITVLMGLA